jgi:hypothetical protein
MSTPIFDELLREFASRMEEHLPEQAVPPVPPTAAGPPGQPNQKAQPPHRHRAE